MNDLKDILDRATRGPWYADFATPNCGFGHNYTYSVASDDFTIFEISTPDGADHQVNVANTSLIAMAPDLAEALIKAREVLEWIVSYPAGHPSYPQAAAALAKDALSEIKKLGCE